jgi:hypothetical protein
MDESTNNEFSRLLRGLMGLYWGGDPTDESVGYFRTSALADSQQ